MLEFRPPHPGDVEQVSVVMHPMDVLECKAAYHTPWQGLRNAVDLSTLVWTGVLDGKPEAMFGLVANVPAGVGNPWFLGSTRARSVQREFLTTAPRIISLMRALTPKMTGVVAVENVAAVRWLQKLGFVVEDGDLTSNGVVLRRFSKGF